MHPVRPIFFLKALAVACPLFYDGAGDLRHICIEARLAPDGFDGLWIGCACLRVCDGWCFGRVYACVIATVWFVLIVPRITRLFP